MTDTYDLNKALAGFTRECSIREISAGEDETLLSVKLCGTEIDVLVAVPTGADRNKTELLVFAPGPIRHYEAEEIARAAVCKALSLPYLPRGPGDKEVCFVSIIKQHRLNGHPCSAPQVVHVQGDDLAEFPDETMAIMQNSDRPKVDAVVIFPCRNKGNNQIEMSPAVYSAGVRSFVIDRSYDPPRLADTSAPDRCHWKIPDTVLAVVGQQIPNTENTVIHCTPKERERAKERGTARWKAKQRKRGMN
jgi:hypothetical protein